MARAKDATGSGLLFTCNTISLTINNKHRVVYAVYYIRAKISPNTLLIRAARPEGSVGTEVGFHSIGSFERNILKQKLY